MVSRGWLVMAPMVGGEEKTHRTGCGMGRPVQQERRSLPSSPSQVEEDWQLAFRVDPEIFLKSKIQHHATLWIILHLDMAKEQQPISHEE